MPGLCNARNWTRGVRYTRVTLCQLSHSFSHSCTKTKNSCLLILLHRKFYLLSSWGESQVKGREAAFVDSYHRTKPFYRPLHKSLQVLRIRDNYSLVRKRRPDQAWWSTHLISAALVRKRQADLCEFQVSVGCRVSSLPQRLGKKMSWFRRCKAAFSWMSACGADVF